jgi:hypothetical protein
MEAWKKFFERFQKDQGPRTIELRLKNRVYTMQDGQHTIENDVYFLVTGYSEFKEDGTVDYIDFWVTGSKFESLQPPVSGDSAIRAEPPESWRVFSACHNANNPVRVPTPLRDFPGPSEPDRNASFEVEINNVNQI